jgi:predicted Zn-dependent protease
MRSGLALLVGVLIGQWLAFGGMQSPADVYRLAGEAAARSDWNEAARQWSHAVALQPDNAYFNYMRAASLARLGHRHAAADALQVTLLLRPEEHLARQIRTDLAGLSGDAGASSTQTAIPLETARACGWSRSGERPAPGALPARHRRQRRRGVPGVCRHRGGEAA